MKQAKYTYWKNCQDWTFSEAFFLIKGLEPVHHQDMLRDPSQELYAEWSQWIKWARRYCGEDGVIQFDDWYYETRPHAEVLEWANSLEGVEVEEMWDDLYKKPESSGTDSELGERERENLLATIGMLAVTLAETKAPKTGDKKKPNLSQIVDACGSVAGHPPGLGKSTLRNRIRDGVNALKEKPIASGGDNKAS